MIDASASLEAADDSLMIPPPKESDRSADLIAVESSVDDEEEDKEVWKDAPEALPRVHWPDGDFASLPFKPSAAVGHSISSKMYTKSPVERWYLEQHAKQYGYVCHEISGLLTKVNIVPLNDEGRCSNAVRPHVHWADGDFVKHRFRPHAKRGHSISSRVYSSCALYRSYLEAHMKRNSCVLDQLAGLVTTVDYISLENEEEIPKLSIETFKRNMSEPILESPDEDVADEDAAVEPPARARAPLVEKETPKLSIETFKRTKLEPILESPDEDVADEDSVEPPALTLVEGEERNNVPLEEVVVPLGEDDSIFELAGHVEEEEGSDIPSEEVAVPLGEEEIPFDEGGELEAETFVPRKRKSRITAAEALKSCLGNYWSVSTSSERPIIRRSARVRKSPNRYIP